MPRRRIAVLTTGRQDYGILRSTILRLQKSEGSELLLWVGGMHLEERFGRTVDLIRADGVLVDRELRFVSDPPCPVRDAARALEVIGEALDEERPDALVLLGDRYETLSAGLAATLRRVPITHLHGGEETEGAIDNAIRHALTKLSHLHLVTHEIHAQRVRQMGEDPDRVVVVGAPGLDNRYREDLPDHVELEKSLGRPVSNPLVMVTMHPTTLGLDDVTAEVEEVAEALGQVGAHYVITQPNADEGGARILAFWESWAKDRANVMLLQALGEWRYWGMLRIADAVVTNSSSGIIEAPAAGVPVVNVGDRQKGRLRYPMAMDVAPRAEAIRDALLAALAPEYKRAVEAMEPLYMPGEASQRIVEALERWNMETPPRKAFHGLEVR